MTKRKTSVLRNIESCVLVSDRAAYCSGAHLHLPEQGSKKYINLWQNICAYLSLYKKLKGTADQHNSHRRVLPCWYRTRATHLSPYHTHPYPLPDVSIVWLNLEGEMSEGCLRDMYDTRFVLFMIRTSILLSSAVVPVTPPPALLVSPARLKSSVQVQSSIPADEGRFKVWKVP
ncbi:hypothetical protein HOY82DRAFT_255595 [Tuber indicum]|nr:hypothetical protein HOY82DRAFT_255595 [Tuber indicum]